MSRVYSNYADIITFTRASGGTALRPISYGDELVTNGTFDTDTSGWTAVLGAISASGGELIVERASGNEGRASAPISCEVGKVYRLTLNRDKGTTGSTTVNVSISSTSAVSAIVSDTSEADGPDEFVFVATQTTHWVMLRCGSGVDGDAASFDNISIREVLFDQPNAPLTLFNHPTNVPRIEYDADGNRLGLLVEEARTNLVTYSEDFSQWNLQSFGTGATPIVTTNQAIAPDGSLTADRLQADRGAGNTASDQSVISITPIYGLSNPHPVSISIWAKSTDGSSTQEVYFRNVSGGAGSTITVTGQWKRFTLSASSIALTSDNIQIGSRGTLNSDNAIDILIYGAQLEAASFPTSYIPTSGSTVTRSADVASIGVSEFGYNSAEGTVFVDVQHFTTESFGAMPAFGLDDGTSSNRMYYYQNKGQWIGSVSGTTVFNIDATDPPEQTKTLVCVTYKKDDFVIYLNGSNIGSDTSGNVPVVNALGIGSIPAINSQLNGHIKSIRYYPRRLTNAQLQELTS